MHCVAECQGRAGWGGEKIEGPKALAPRCSAKPSQLQKPPSCELNGIAKGEARRAVVEKKQILSPKASASMTLFAASVFFSLSL